MHDKLAKILNFFSFGLMNKIAKKKANVLSAKKNSVLKLNTTKFVEVKYLLFVLGKKENIKCITNTVSTITIELYDVGLVDWESLKKICKKGIIKTNNSVSLLIGDCAEKVKNELISLF